MYLRRTQRRNKDGSVVRYLQLASNYREGVATRARIMLSLGREDSDTRGQLEGLADSIRRYLDASPAGDSVDQSQEGAACAPAGQSRREPDDVAPAADLSVATSRPIGSVWLLDALWDRLRVPDTLQALVGEPAAAKGVERALFALVANRALNPYSNQTTTDWANDDVAVPGMDEMSEAQAYRAMELLVQADAGAELQRRVFTHAADLLQVDPQPLLFDTTSSSFEREAPKAAHQAFRLLGQARQERPSPLPRVVIGLAATREGIPVRCWMWPGAATGPTILETMQRDLRKWDMRSAVPVIDERAAEGEPDRRLTAATTASWVTGRRLRPDMAQHHPALTRDQGRRAVVGDNLRIREVYIAEDGAQRRYVVCHSADEAERDRAWRASTIARLEIELDRSAGARPRDSRSPTPPSRLPSRARRFERALLDHPTLGRYLTLLPSGSLCIDRGKIRAEERVDGTFLLAASDPTMPAEDLALGFMGMMEAERGFCALKTSLELRPVFNLLEHRVRAHVLVCWLALLLIRCAEHSTQRSWQQVSAELGRLHRVTLSGEAGTITQTTEITESQRDLYRACQVKPPPRVHAP